jgi:hypothetical protein
MPSWTLAPGSVFFLTIAVHVPPGLPPAAKCQRHSVRPDDAWHAARSLVPSVQPIPGAMRITGRCRDRQRLRSRARGKTKRRTTRRARRSRRWPARRLPGSSAVDNHRYEDSDCAHEAQRQPPSPSRMGVVEPPERDSGRSVHDARDDPRQCTGQPHANSEASW